MDLYISQIGYFAGIVSGDDIALCLQELLTFERKMKFAPIQPNY